VPLDPDAAGTTARARFADVARELRQAERDENGEEELHGVCIMEGPDDGCP
jgi:hypothetical protein